LLTPLDLFIFSIPIPEKIPSVFQASHHSVSASYGVVCKIQRKCTLQIWDHAIAWRETNLCLSSALCKLPPFVRNSLLGLMRLTSVLILHHADIILPCADFFNPAWEVEIGTCQGTLEHRNAFRRKIDPVVNGITDMHKFAPVKEIKTEKPTVTMLSHVWFAKDIKTAILAADIIVNEWGFSDYHLDIYGALDKAPTYSTECQEILASKSLRENCTLRGTADPTRVLENTWLFLNSSISEGLPLALGEAALTGAPVVCTDVGASLRVLSDPDDFSRFSAVVAPNDARALARAQINMLGMLDEWAKFAKDTEPAPVLTSSPTPEDVAKITKRMYTKSEFRRELGMKTRAIVQKSFSGDRYLREHEQMLWVGKYRKLMANRIYPETDDFSEIEKAIKEPVEEKIISLPRRILPSWASSNRSSGRSSFRTSMGAGSTLMLDPHTRDRREVLSFTSHSSFTTRAESMMLRPDSYAAQRPGSELRPPGAWPVFAPRDSMQSKHDLKKMLKKGFERDGDRGRSKLYRSSDISSLAPTERMNLSAF
jgi:glycosyltransferase involved in cell wall biosynthesis